MSNPHDHGGDRIHSGDLRDLRNGSLSPCRCEHAPAIPTRGIVTERVDGRSPPGKENWFQEKESAFAAGHPDRLAVFHIT